MGDWFIPYCKSVMEHSVYRSSCIYHLCGVAIPGASKDWTASSRQPMSGWTGVIDQIVK
jgi:hypothetical protein